MGSPVVLNARQVAACRRLLVSLGQRVCRDQEFPQLVNTLLLRQQLRHLAPTVYAVRYKPAGGANVINRLCFSQADVVSAVTAHIDELYPCAAADRPKRKL